MVLLRCVKIKNRLRVVIDDTNYNCNLFCSFPRDIRCENGLYDVKPENIRFITLQNPRASKYYSIVCKDKIKIIDENDASSINTVIPLPTTRIFEDVDTSLCAICMTEEKFFIYEPCGHFYICEACNNLIKKNGICPICRCEISNYFSKLLL